MPLHEYECEACQHRFEMLQKFNDPPQKRCPKCRGKVKRLISAPGIHFKGSGWYVTDYGRKGAASSDGGDVPASSSSSDSSSSEDKPEAAKPAAAPAAPSRPARRRPASSRRRKR